MDTVAHDLKEVIRVLYEISAKLDRNQPKDMLFETQPVPRTTPYQPAPYYPPYQPIYSPALPPNPVPVWSGNTVITCGQPYSTANS